MNSIFKCTAIAMLLTSVSVQAIEKHVVDNKEKQSVTKNIAELMKANYVFPKKGEEMAEQLTSHLSSGTYNSINDPVKFANLLTEQLIDITQDKHIRVRFAPEVVKSIENESTDDGAQQEAEKRLQQLKRVNFGFEKIDILAGNIGYLKLNNFFDTETAGDTAVAAMNFLSNTDALIIDLRENGGGSPSMIQLISSYLFDAEPVYLNNFYWRPSDSYTQTWTLPHISGKRRPDADVYVLTSNRTFSAAEEFTYNLKYLKRATIVGETTGGGAHPGGVEVAGERFTVWIPSGRAINPNTGTNWEGTGVKPDIETSAGQALEHAKHTALKSLIDKADDKQAKKYYQFVMTNIAAKLNPVTLSQELLASYAGDYGNRELSFKDGQLLYQRKGAGNPRALVPLSETTFKIAEIDNFQLEVLFENGKIIALQGLYEDGYSDISHKVN